MKTLFEWCAAVALAGACLAGQENAADIRAGMGRVDITPPLGAFIPGYFSQRLATGVGTPLTAECLAFSDGRSEALVYTVDNLHLTKRTIDALKAKLKADWGIPPELVFVHSTHIHTGAATDSSYYREIEDEKVRALCDAYGESLVPKMVQAAERARNDLKSAKFRFARGEVRPAISFIRRYRMKDGTVVTNPSRNHPERVADVLGEADNSVQVVRLVREGAPDIALVNFQTHPDTVGGLLYHADWPGDLRATFEKALGDGTRLFFMNGAQGDTNHFQVLGENPFWKDHPFSDYHAYMGRAVAGAVLEVWDRTQPVEATGGIRGVITPTRVASNRPDAARIEAIRLFDAGRKEEIRGFGSMEIMSLCDKNSRARQLMNGPDWFEMPVSALSVGGVLAFAGFPGEPFTEIGSKVKAGSPFPMTFVGCLVNDSFGYLPSSSAAKEGGYEVVSSRFGATCGDTLVRVQLENLKTLSRAGVLDFDSGVLSGRFDPETFALEVKDVRCGRVWKTLDDGLRPADGVAVSVRAEANELVLEFAADAAAEVSERFLAAKPFAAEGNDRFFVPMGCGWSFPAEGWDFGEYVADWDMSRMRLYTGFMKMGCFAQYAESVAADGSLAQGAGYLAIFETPVDAEVTFKARSNGRLGMGAEWRGERGRFGYARRIRFVFFDRATMGAMAARYRAEMDRRGYRVTFAEKAKRHPKLAERLKLLKGAPDVWYWTERDDKAAVAEELRKLGFGNMIFSTITRHDLGAWIEPDDVKALAKVPGVLASEYDIVNDAMEPAMLPKLDAVRPHWPLEVWDRGDYVMDAKGEVARGWKVALKEDPTKPVVGCIKICAAKGPYYQRQRIEKRLAEAPYAARFYDVTGTGVSECYHPSHPLTLRQSVDARRTMLGLPGREYGLVTGTEEGLECFVPECDYLEGNFSAYTWRVDGGRYMWKTYETSPKVMKYAIDPATRCPFWEMVFHDCVSTFWYWTDYNNRFLDTWWRRDALNAITGTAPMYLFTPEVFAAQKERLAESVKVAARTARETADALLVDYRWLSADRLVQESRFSNGVVVTVNFSETPRMLADGRTLAPHEVVFR